jgi:protein-tyrosine phosphatase
VPRIVIVCTKNQFRSPLAAAILRNELATRKISGQWVVESAGSWVHDLSPASPHAIEQATKRGLDLGKHTAKGIEEIDRQGIDLLLVMEEGQKEAILLDYPFLKDRTYLLSELSGAAYTIPDPYLTGESFSEIASEIESLIHDNIEKIISLAYGIFHPNPLPARNFKK